jgi:polysaccharide biosynthesis/export protein
MKTIKIGLIAGIVFLIVGCTPPGTYFSASSVKKDVNINGREFHPQLIPIDSKLLQDTSKSINGNVFKKPPEYRIGMYDYVGIVVWGHPELSLYGSSSGGGAGSISSNQLSAVVTGGAGSAQAGDQGGSEQMNGFRVNADGCIFYPWIGKIKLAGLTTEKAQKIITRRLSEYVVDPQVIVQVTSYRSRQTFMVGEIGHQGILPLTDKPISLFEAINTFGGIVTDSADTARIYVIRGSLKGLNVYWLNARSPMALVLSEHFYLQPDDIVYVSPAPIVSWNRVMAQILPTVQNIWYTYDITDRVGRQ